MQRVGDIKENWGDTLDNFFNITVDKQGAEDCVSKFVAGTIQNQLLKPLRAYLERQGVTDWMSAIKIAGEPLAGHVERWCSNRGSDITALQADQKFATCCKLIGAHLIEKGTLDLSVNDQKVSISMRRPFLNAHRTPAERQLDQAWKQFPKTMGIGQVNAPAF